MIVRFDITGRCPDCHTVIHGIATHNAYTVGHAWRIADDGIVAWAPCPSGCPEWHPPGTVIYTHIRTRLKEPA